MVSEYVDLFKIFAMLDLAMAMSRAGTGFARSGICRHESRVAAEGCHLSTE
jgi:hypothetical protein